MDIARGLRPSLRGELEITDVNRAYMIENKAKLVKLGRGFAWMDAGTPESLLAASMYVHTVEQRQGVHIACVEEVALRMGFIDAQACYRLGERVGDSAYGEYVRAVADESLLSPGL